MGSSAEGSPTRTQSPAGAAPPAKCTSFNQLGTCQLPVKGGVTLCLVRASQSGREFPSIFSSIVRTLLPEHTSQILLDKVVKNMHLKYSFMAEGESAKRAPTQPILGGFTAIVKYYFVTKGKLG